jgi:hypothetical protein
VSAFIEWTSAGAINRPTTGTYYVAKFDPKIRKRVALVRSGSVANDVVAYFCGEEAAIRFCDEVLGGRVKS